MGGQDFSSVTEAVGQRVSQEQLVRAYSRYEFAALRSKDRDVLEVGCGAGFGLGLLGLSAKRVFAGDYTFNLLQTALAHYGTRFPLLQFDGQFLPFRSRSFDIVLLFEAIYYLPRPELFLSEAHRVLRENGELIIVSVNREWSDFNPSPFSFRYLSSEEFKSLFQDAGFDCTMRAAFSTLPCGARQKFVSFLKRAATKLHLIPNTMEGKQMLKRIFFGKLKDLSPELKPGEVEYVEPEPLQNDATQNYKVLYAQGTKQVSRT